MPIGGAPPDELLRLSGSTNNYAETVTANGNGSAVYYGEQKLVGFRLLIAGVSGTNPTLDIKFQASADGSTGWADTGVAFPQQTIATVAANGSQGDPPRVALRVPNGKPYLRIVKTIGGTVTPTFTGVQVVPDPVMNGPVL